MPFVQLLNWLGGVAFFLLMLLAGAVCIMRLSDQPKKHWLVGGVIVLLLFTRFAAGNISQFIFRLSGPGTVRAMGHYFSAIVMIPSAIALIAAWGLILYVAFGLEDERKSRYLIEDDHPREFDA